jgi:WXG100 family type VII secretion target
VAVVTGPGFQSDAAAMTAAVNGFDESSRNCSSTMTQMESELRDALSRYKGQQATAFWQLQNRLHEDMQRASRELSVMSDLVHKSFRNYGSGDEQAAQSITGLTSQVGAGGSVLGRLGG